MYKQLHKFVGNIMRDFTLLKAQMFEKDKYQVFLEIEKVKKQVECQQTLSEAYNLISALRATSHLNGDIAELGTFKGGSAKLIQTFKRKDKKLHLFDTWEGIPANSEGFTKEQFAASFEDVKRFIGDDACFHKGYFPQTTTEEATYSFVHLDGDIQQSIYDGLNYFYPRMEKGGIIIIHDWGLMGVKLAFFSYFKDRQPMTFSHGTQAMVIKYA